LGRPLALEFTRVHLPECFGKVGEIFSRRGAFARFKDLLDRHESLDAWHEWAQEHTRQSLRQWCADNAIKWVD
jgi:hypothetical protein